MHYHRHYPTAREIDFFARESVDPSMACNSHRIPVSVREAMRDILDAFSNKAIDNDPRMNLSQERIQVIRKAYAKLFNGESDRVQGARMALTGTLVEHIAARHTKNIIGEKHIPLDVINVPELEHNFPSHDFGGGHLPDQVTFVEPIGKQPFMEVDLLLQTYAKDGFLAFDFTSRLDSKKLDVKDRSERVDYVSREVLKAPLALIDASLGEERLSLDKQAENLFRMNVPCCTNFRRIVDRFLRDGK